MHFLSLHPPGAIYLQRAGQWRGTSICIARGGGDRLLLLLLLLYFTSRAFEEMIQASSSSSSRLMCIPSVSFQIPSGQWRLLLLLLLLLLLPRPTAPYTPCPPRTYPHLSGLRWELLMNWLIQAFLKKILFQPFMNPQSENIQGLRWVNQRGRMQFAPTIILLRQWQGRTACAQNVLQIFRQN